MPHFHISEECIHGNVKRRLCEHQVPASWWRIREVPCAETDCINGTRPPVPAPQAGQATGFNAVITEEWIMLRDGASEIVFWHRSEWEEDPSVTTSIANALVVGYTQGAASLRRHIAD